MSLDPIRRVNTPYQLPNSSSYRVQLPFFMLAGTISLVAVKILTPNPCDKERWLSFMSRN